MKMASSVTKGARARSVDVTRNLSYRLLLLSNTLGRSAAHELVELVQITVPEWRIISVVGSRGPISLNELAQTIAVDKAWVSRTLVSLEKRGFMVRTAQPHDGRVFTLTLTDEGRALHLQASDWSTRRQKHLRASFSAQEYELLESFLARLQITAEEMLDRPVRKRP